VTFPANRHSNTFFDKRSIRRGSFVSFFESTSNLASLLRDRTATANQSPFHAGSGQDFWPYRWVRNQSAASRSVGKVQSTHQITITKEGGKGAESVPGKGVPDGTAVKPRSCRASSNLGPKSNFLLPNLEARPSASNCSSSSDDEIFTVGASVWAK
jgi:hypothetical protein